MIGGFGRLLSYTLPPPLSSLQDRRPTTSFPLAGPLVAPPIFATAQALKLGAHILFPIPHFNLDRSDKKHKIVIDFS